MTVGTLFIRNWILYVSFGLKEINGADKVIAKPFPFMKNKMPPMAYSLEDSIPLPICLSNITIEDTRINLERLKYFLEFNLDKVDEEEFFMGLKEKKESRISKLTSKKKTLGNHYLIGVFENNKYLIAIQEK